jgi:hypothetical protein
MRNLMVLFWWSACLSVTIASPASGKAHLFGREDAMSQQVAEYAYLLVEYRTDRGKQTRDHGKLYRIDETSITLRRGFWKQEIKRDRVLRILAGENA